jgi:uncharacterized membrane protein YeaQ/YmgE (transglycosylase-associated protein family)
MFAYLVAGLIVGGLMRYVRHRSGDPSLAVQLVVGAVAAGVGGLVVNVFVGDDFMAVDSWGFAGAAITAYIALAFVLSRGRRDRVDRS